MSINQAERASIRTETLLKNDTPERIKSIGFPVSASMAGIEVTTAINKTKRKLVTDLTRAGKSGIRINPIPIITADEITNKTVFINLLKSHKFLQTWTAVIPLVFYYEENG